jgi:hypothetical protein
VELVTITSTFDDLRLDLFNQIATRKQDSLR